MLLAVPHLFSADTNRYDPGDDYPATLALPAIWDSFPDFYNLAAAATRLSEMDDDPAALRTASLALRGS